ncbi:glycosyltransferase [Nocardioides mangrovicus]|uniref:glycosyltransferase n=1 Tax=Nocardioides mangrovicus TaxID=2478913 RepID=UPI00131488DB|nr:glycosyltransferase [Nocardioides mangrovicus]
MAIPFVTTARMLGIPCHYIESAARADGPSLTGRVMQRTPGVNLYSQYSRWSDDRWSYRGSLFDSFRARPVAARAPRRVVVTLGTMRAYSFRRAVDRLIDILPAVLAPDAEVVWQVGATDPGGLAGDVRVSLANAELRALISSADLVIAHAGIGSALTALELGCRPVLLPRRAAHQEHVDDHQTLIARELDSRGLAISREADLVTADDLLAATAARVDLNQAPAPFSLRS